MPESDRELNFFKARGNKTPGEIKVILLVLAGWMLAIVSFQLFNYLLEINYSELLLEELTFFNLPIHFWLTGQFVPLWFIILCIIFNFWMDKHADRSLDGSLRFRVRSTKKVEE
jgi:putative solute:sodium symporter small subunit